MPARVVLVEDDASIRRFVGLALEELPITLVECESLREGRAALAEGADLLITDLMLPDGHGTELLSGTPRRGIVFSAGVTAALRERLQGLGVWSILDKPVSIGALVEAVESALAMADAAAPATATAAPGAGDAVQRHFGGDASLYAAFKAQAVAQFAADIAEGDRCTAAGDLPALRRLAHNLKSVLLLLGDEAGSAEARTLEQQAQAGDAACAARWPGLRERVQAWQAG